MRRRRLLVIAEQQALFEFDEFGDVITAPEDLEAARRELPSIGDDAASA